MRAQFNIFSIMMALVVGLSGTEVSAQVAPAASSQPTSNSEDEEIRPDLIDPEIGLPADPSELNREIEGNRELTLKIQNQKLKDDKTLLTQFERELRTARETERGYILETAAGPVIATLTLMGRFKSVGDLWMALGARTCRLKAEWIVNRAAAKAGRKAADEFRKTAAFEEEVTRVSRTVFREWRRGKLGQISREIAEIQKTTQEIVATMPVGPVRAKTLTELFRREGELGNLYYKIRGYKQGTVPSLNAIAELRTLHQVQKRETDAYLESHAADLKRIGTPSAGWARLRRNTYGLVIAASATMFIHGLSNWVYIEKTDMAGLLADIASKIADIEDSERIVKFLENEYQVDLEADAKKLEQQVSERIASNGN